MNGKADWARKCAQAAHIKMRLRRHSCYEKENKTSLHSFEHALFGYMTASQVKGKSFDVYYALPEWESASHDTVSPYMFFGNVVGVESCGEAKNLPDGNTICKVTYNGLH